MTWIVTGVLVWSIAHLFRRIAPGPRASLGNGGKGLVALVSVIAIGLMVLGYKSAEPVFLWQFGGWASNVNNLMMLIAVVLFGLGSSKSRLRGSLRHPMLVGVIVWAAAHLLVNGDLPSLVLFGGMGVWAIAEIVLINRSEPPPKPFTLGTVQGDIRLAVISAVLFAVIVGIHIWVGPSPFGA